MKQMQQLTAIIEHEGDGYVSLCPELDIASQGDTVEEAQLNLIEALEGFFEAADPAEGQAACRIKPRRISLRSVRKPHPHLPPHTLRAIIAPCQTPNPRPPTPSP